MPIKAETASQTSTISAPLDRVFAIASDFERYPEWATDVKEATVRKRDEEGRAVEVEFRASALGRSTHYALAYDYAQAPAVLSWTMGRGDIMRTIDGAYHFSEGVHGATDVRYDLAIELVVPLPGFVKRRAEQRILNTVRELKSRSES
jgi:ribosome-associated toxin RatA of RatAB toxin-antitoxin module